MSDIVDKVLAHHGVKGMKWGVRKNDSSGRSRGFIRRGLTKADVATDAGHKVISEGEKKLIFLPLDKRRAAATKTQGRILAEAIAVNRSPKFRGKDLKGNKPLRDAYFKKVEERAKTIYAEELGIARVQAWGEVLNVNTDATVRSIRISAAANRIKHAADGDQEILLELKYTTNDLGQIKSIEVPDKFLKQDSVSSTVDDILEHYGVKGMHWGVRKSDSTRQRLGLQSRSATKPKPSEDKASANASAAKVKRGNTDSLSNKELQQLVNRMNLEQQYSRLSSQSGTIKRGQQGVKDVLAVGKTANEAAQFAQSPIGKAIGRGIKAAALSAAAAAGKMAAKRALKRS